MSSIITIGKFDGVHLGHLSLLTLGQAMAHERGAKLVVMPFDPHPLTVLVPGSQPPRLASWEAKQRLLEQGGADVVHRLMPEPRLLDLVAEDYIAHLVEQYHPIAIIGGEDFRFGKARRGDMAMLSHLGKKRGFEAIVAPKLSIGLSDKLVMPVRSTHIRWLIQHGRVVDAAMCLGRFYQLNGKVVQGEQRGRTIGVPTANLDPHSWRDDTLPSPGVYAGWVTIEDEIYSKANRHLAAISVGVKPTFNGQCITIEAHLLDFEQNLYDKTISIHFARWLRDQDQFLSVQHLQQQLQRDIQQTRRYAQRDELECPSPAYVERAGFSCLTNQELV